MFFFFISRLQTKLSTIIGQVQSDLVSPNTRQKTVTVMTETIGTANYKGLFTWDIVTAEVSNILYVFVYLFKYVLPCLYYINDLIWRNDKEDYIGCNVLKDHFTAYHHSQLMQQIVSQKVQSSDRNQ